MTKLISCCGLDCSACEAYIAFQTNDQDLRIRTAEKWRTQYGNTSITPEMINCSGCLSDNEVKLSHCNECLIRKCAMEKNLPNCGPCEQLLTCETIAHVHKHVPEALENLRVA